MNCSKNERRKKLMSVILGGIGISVRFKRKKNCAQRERLEEHINTGRGQATWRVPGMMSKSYQLHHLTYIEKQCDKRLEYIAHRGI